jgi:hypothetical protein
VAGIHVISDEEVSGVVCVLTALLLLLLLLLLLTAGWSC